MHEVLIISGKGGTGKTSLTAAFAHLSDNAVLCDLDVDAPDLHLVLRPELSTATPFIAGFEAHIDGTRCSHCGTCLEMCRFGAVQTNTTDYRINPLRCEGCGVCVKFCPEKAIDFTAKHCGEWRISNTRFGPLVHAQLFPGQENSGKLVAQLRQEAKTLAKEKGARLVISDGPPGIGCPVISAISGQDLAVLVTEPTPSGLHDLKRVVELCGHFRLPAVVIINKYDLHATLVHEIKTFCVSQNLPVVAQLPHDPDFVHAMVRAVALTEYSQGSTAQAVRNAFNEIMCFFDSSNGRVIQSRAAP
ncbi:MAG: ATP-binding protein [Desulfobacteraceae bacterium]|nr:ATP-binding protein [Desulfobacteraceae bacterium]